MGVLLWIVQILQMVFLIVLYRIRDNTGKQCNQTTLGIAFLFSLFPGNRHNFVNVSLWLPILAAGSLIYEEQDCILRAGL